PQVVRPRPPPRVLKGRRKLFESSTPLHLGLKPQALLLRPVGAQPGNPVLPEPRSTWSPLRHTIFRWLWIASVASNVGTWFQNVGASWLMTTLSPSPALVAMVQAATSLPMFL